MGVFRLVDPRPVNVIIRALPMPPRKVTEFVPLPAQPAHVNVPLVLKVTGSAFATADPSVSVSVRTRTLIHPFKMPDMIVSSVPLLPSALRK